MEDKEGGSMTKSDWKRVGPENVEKAGTFLITQTKRDWFVLECQDKPCKTNRRGP